MLIRDHIDHLAEELSPKMIRLALQGKYPDLEGNFLCLTEGLVTLTFR